MTEITVSSPQVENSNAATKFGENPFLGGSNIHVNPPSEAAVFASWRVDAFPFEGLAFLAGTVGGANPNWRGAARLEFTAMQGDRIYRSECRFTHEARKSFGIGFVYQNGLPLILTLTLAIDTADSFGNGLFLVSDLQIERPVFESIPQLFDLGALSVYDDGPPIGMLTSANQGGLMNRMVPMLSAVLIAERSRRKPQVLWGPNDHCAAAFADLFEVNDGMITDGDIGSLGNDYSIYVGYDHETPPLAIDLPINSLVVHAISPLRTQPEIVHSHADLGAVFRRFILAKPVREMLRNYRDMDFTRTVALHIRRPYPGGAFAELETAKFGLGIDVFKGLVEDLRTAVPWMERVLVCTNSLEAEADMRNAFGDLIVTFPKSSIDNTRDPIAVQEALVDMTLMSRCPLLFSQETTSFGHFAHLVGGNIMVAVTRDTTADRYEFWQFADGRHMASQTCWRGDTPALRQTIEAWLPPAQAGRHN